MAEVLIRKTLNGVDVDALIDTVGAIAEDPALGSFQFRSSTQWKKGAQVETTFTGHKRNGVDSTRDVPHTWGGDEPVGLLGTGLHQGPTDSLLHSMSHCLTVSTAYHGAAKSIQIDKLTVDASGTLDLQGFLGLNPKKRAGFKEIHLQMSIDSPNSTEEVVELFNYAQGRSPICQTVRGATNIVFEFDIEDTGAAEAYTDDDEDRHGVSYKGVMGTIEAIKADPNFGKAKFYTHTEWKGGAKVETTSHKFEMPPGNMQVRDEPITLVGDEPPALLGDDAGPGPSETVLHGVANCISVCNSYHSAASDIRVSDFKVEFEGDLDLQGFTDVNDTVTPAYKTIKCKITARSGGTSHDELMAFVENISQFSPIYDTVRNPVHVTFGLTHNGQVVNGGA